MSDVAFRFSALSQADLAVLGQMAQRLGAADFPAYHAAAEELSAMAEATYSDYLRGHALPSGRVVPRWLRGEGGGELAGLVHRSERDFLVWGISIDDDRAKQVEEGTPAWDMKEGLTRYRKARISKKGVFYLIVPFRHGTPQSRNMGRPMPKEVYAMAKRLKHSTNLGAASTRVSASGFTVPKWAYRWGGKITPGQLFARFTVEDAKLVKQYSGLVRMNKGGHTEYITFRTMSQNSDPSSWIRPAVEPMNALRTAIEITWESGRPRLEAALNSDLLRLVRPGA